ncbi:MAG: tRNA (adenosine(37)-N6)-dimethylallyltransferase MiaA [Thermomicrobiales bacterium]|nr:tRNA (adenosine(37)-N6)-dimethylallyltransferase MiaA [Thermomicrobiales bacterium]
MNATTVATSKPANKQPLVAVVGATTVGKTSAAICLARDLGGEVVSADSRYLYRGMDIGTATPSEDEMAGVPHYLINILDPTDDYSLSLYQRDAYQAIDDILRRGRLPILAGGTPLYVNAVLQGWRIPEVPPDPAFRAALEELATSEGPESLHARLREADPVVAARTPAANVRRVIRALEIYHATGQRMSDLEGREPPPYRVLILGLQVPREELFARIDRRVEVQIASGLVAEVRALLARGVPPGAPAMSAIGYPQIVDYLENRNTLDQAIRQIKYDTHRYARHQMTWLRRMRDVHWFDPREAGWYEAALALARSFAGNETAQNPLA